MGSIGPDVGALWLNGSLVDPAAASISPFDHGITVGDGCFETMKVVDGSPFALRRHLERLRSSLVALELDLSLTDDELGAACAAVVAADAGAGVIRLTVTAGLGPLGSARHDSTPTVMVASGPDRGWEGPTPVVTVPWVRNERSALAGVKSTSYAENVRALARARRAGATEAIFANTVGNLCEGTGTNVFVELDGRLVTPPLSSGCLAGVTRALVLEQNDIEERDVPYAHLFETSEVFVTSSTRDVMAVRRIDDRVVAAPGPLTEVAAAAFAAAQLRSLDP